MGGIKDSSGAPIQQERPDSTGRPGVRMRKLVMVVIALVSSAAVAQDAESPLAGRWLGRIEYVSSVDPVAHSEQVTAFTVDREGRIEGRSLNGCRFAGTAKARAAEPVADLDVAFEGCRYLLMNRPFKGQMLWDARSRTAQLDLRREDPAGEQVALYQVRGIVVP